MPSAETAFADALALPFFDPEPVDQLRSLLGDEMVTELVQEFETSGVENLSRLDVALAGGDAVSAQREVHSLKSAAASLGLTRLSRLCFAVECDCRDGSLILAGKAKEALAENYAEACRFLRDMKVA
ncbi:MAG TPA: Hpt domain-containing protein [Candidatus Sulfotelmatobacter sp.]|jgi:HPt (histidine-containing phosphotransfer) domain-containing protein|nr:Hpt domain-containing protein [Candidatus Sulfotelmatobacter sp.]